METFTPARLTGNAARPYDAWMAVLRILGIDPGTQVIGYACLQATLIEHVAPRSAEVPLLRRASNVVGRACGSGKATLLAAGSVQLGKRRDPLPARLHCLAESIDALIRRFSPTELALEEAFFGKSVQSALRVGEARGVVLAAGHRHGLEIHQYPPAKIKRAVTGRGAAAKEVVAAMASQLLGIGPLTGSRDASDAVAVALCRLEDRRSLHPYRSWKNS